MTAVAELLDLLDLAMSRAEGVLLPETGVRHRAATNRLRARSGFVGDALVVAVAGGTGCGKSSIVNAVVGSPVAATGVVRPTTARALAVMSPVPHVHLDPLLDLLDVADRVTCPGLGPLVLVDLPDFDSTDRRHREQVERMLPRVDAVIWVLDPEKYADPLLHEEFLAGLGAFSSQFVFVLNQADRLGDATATVVEGLKTILDAHGLGASPVVATVADPRIGVDVDALEGELDRRWEAKTMAMRAMALEVRRIASEGWREIGAATEPTDHDTAALARATFVSLGVAAYDLHHRLGGTAP